MHDVFTLSELNDDRLHQALLFWLDTGRRDPDLPLAAFGVDRLPPVIEQFSVTLALEEQNIRHARHIRAGEFAISGLGLDPVGRTLSQVLRPSYVAEISPAYALCAGIFHPIAMQDEIGFADGRHFRINRMVLPLGRLQPHRHRVHAASHLLMIFSPVPEASGAEDTIGEADDVPLNAHRQMISVRSLGLRMFRDVHTAQS